jgi:hypothetical protein
MSSIYNYTAFGLNFQSEFEIPEFLSSNNQPDVSIRIGKVPSELKNVNKSGVSYQATKDEFLLEIDNIARFYVKHGTEIIVEPKHKDIDKEIRLFLLGSALGALFVQRGLLPIHGSAIKIGKKATIFSGPSGVGKSSIAAYFSKIGFQVLNDDISVIDSELKLNPGFPKMKIWHDVAKKLELQINNLSEIRPSIQKYHLPINSVFCNQALSLERMIIIQSKNTPQFECEELTGIKKFNAVKNNTYRYRFVEGLEKQQDHFVTLNKLIPKIKVYRVSRPQSSIQLKEFADFLIKTLNIDV